MVAVNYIGCGDHCAIDTDVKHVRYLKLYLSIIPQWKKKIQL